SIIPATDSQCLTSTSMIPASNLPSSGQYLRLETIGRRTRSPHNVLLRFIVLDRKIVVFPQNQGRQDWVENVRRNPHVKLFGADRTFSGHAQIKQISGLKDPLLAVFTRKYGEDEVRKRYWGQTRYVDIEIVSESSAEHYDDHILGNPMNVWLRNRSVNYLSKIFRPGEVVLEIGCGTGTETLLLA